VNNEGDLTIDNGNVNGNIVVNDANQVTLNNSDIDGNVDITNSNDVTVTDSSINGNFAVEGSDPVIVSGNTINGNLSATGVTTCNVSGNTSGSTTTTECSTEPGGDPSIDPTSGAPDLGFTINDPQGRFLPDDVVFFIDAAGVETQTPCNVTSTTVINCTVPQVSTGPYTVEVRNSPTDPPVFPDVLSFTVT